MEGWEHVRTKGNLLTTINFTRGRNPREIHSQITLIETQTISGYGIVHSDWCRKGSFVGWNMKHDKQEEMGA